MAILVWITVGIALWHFTVFLPDRFWAGIVGAFLGAVAGALVVGAIFLLLDGQSVGNTTVGTALSAIPGVVIGLGIVWLIGSREPHYD